MRSQPALPFIALPYARLELPGWGHVLRAVGVLTDAFGDARWKDAPMRTVRGKGHGYLMRLDLSNWSERLTYFLGRHHETSTELFVEAAVRPGDTVVDIGGNVGMVTLQAARLVGAHGQVHTFEPNPLLVRRLQEVLDLNQLHHVILHPVGLSDAPGELTLQILCGHSGQGTLAELDEGHVSQITERHVVPIEVGDQSLPADLPGPALIKIDVEGFETRAIRGLRALVERLKPAIFTEVSPEYLKRAGSSATELFDLMHGQGYRGYNLNAVRSGLRQYTLQLSPVTDEAGLKTDNVVWLVDGTVHQQRLAKFIA